MGAGLPQAAAEIYASFDTATAAGYFEDVADGVESLTGRKPTSIAEFLTANAGALAGA